MPLFSTNKFLPKKPPQRKTVQNLTNRRKFGDEEEFKYEIGKIKLNVGDQNAVFEDGEWIPDLGVNYCNAVWLDIIWTAPPILHPPPIHVKSPSKWFLLVSEGGVSGQRVKDHQRVKQHLLQLQEENNLLKIKNEVLLDMLTETTAEAHLQDKELTRLRQQVMLLKSSKS